MDTVTLGVAREVGSEAPKNAPGGRRTGLRRLTAIWYLWYAMACGLRREEVYSTHFGQVQDLTAIYQIKEEGAEFAGNAAS